jgi:hypothetical protein
MPSWVELCFLDMVFTPLDRVNTDLTEIHVYGVPGYKRMSGQLVISPSVQKFLRTFVVDILFRQSALIQYCPFQKMQVWLYDSTVPEAERPYNVPKITPDALTLNAEIESARLKIIHILRKLEDTVDDGHWAIVAETLLRSLFAEFIEMPVGSPLFH